MIIFSKCISEAIPGGEEGHVLILTPFFVLLRVPPITLIPKTGCSFYISFNSLGGISLIFIGTSRRVQLTWNCRLDISTSGSSRSSTSLVCEINFRKHHLLAWYTFTTNKIHSFLCWRSASNFLEANIADLNFGGRLKTK